MSLFPAYGHDEEVAKNRDERTLVNKEVHTEILDWLQNKSCPADIGVVPKQEALSRSFHPDESIPLIIDNTQLKCKKHKDRKKKKHSRDSTRSRSKDVHKQKRKKSTSRKDQKKEKECNSSIFDQTKAHENLAVWSELLEKMKSVFMEECGLDRPERAYFLSVKGDNSNRSFDRTPFHQQPKYKALNCTLGMPAAQMKYKKQKRYFSKSVRKSYITEGCSIRPVNRNFVSGDGYIPLALTIEEESKLRRERTSDLEKDEPRDPGGLRNDEHEEFSSEVEYWQSKMKAFNEKLTRHPKDVSLWLDFVRIQDKAFTHIYPDQEHVAKKKSVKKNLKAVTERKIAILDSAIQKNTDSLQLKYERLHLGQDIWDSDALHREWNELVSHSSTDISVWRNYLFFNQTYFPSYNLLQVSKAYATCASKLGKISSSAMLDISCSIGHHLVDLAVQLGSLWCQLGYMERTVALMQALIELNFYCPQKLQNAFAPTKIDMFEAFWDSKAPRVGEQNSIGWAAFMLQGIAVDFPESIIGGTKDEEDDIFESKADFSKLWHDVESSRELCNWLPWQLDPDECEDPDRMVAFDCLRDHLFVLESEADRNYLLMQFLELLFPEESSLGKCDNFSGLKLESLQCLFLDKEHAESDIFCFGGTGPSVYKIQSGTYFDFLCGVIYQMMPLCNTEMRTNLALKLMNLYRARLKTLSGSPLNQAFIKFIRRKTKSLLKKTEFRASIRLYHAYGLLEQQIGSRNDAINVFLNAISLGVRLADGMLSNYAIPVLICLKSYIKYKVSNDVIGNINPQYISSIIAMLVLQHRLIADDDKVDSADVIRAKRKLRLLIESELTNIESKKLKNSFVCHAISLLVMLEYLSIDFYYACAVMKSYIDGLRHLDLNNKDILYEDYLWLIETAPRLHKLIPYWPLSRNSLRDILNCALEAAPGNLTIMKKIAQNQSWRDHFLFSGANSSTLSIVLRVLPHIHSARKMLAGSGATGSFSIGHKIEHILESALQSTTGKTCPLLWRLYLRVVSLVHPAALQSACYQALHNCPGSKCIYLDCVQLVPEMLKEIVLLMQEKKVRVRLPLEELEILLEKEDEMI